MGAIDRNTLAKVAAPTPNPLALAGQPAGTVPDMSGSLGFGSLRGPLRSL